MASSLPSILSAHDFASSPPTDQDVSGQAASQPQASPAATPNLEHELGVLRSKLDDESSSPESLIRDIADAARTLTGAEGLAIALRTRGAVVCRARSGDLAPEVGTPLNLQSGISGECLRSASILVCNDALDDARVDPEVCRSMGIGSLVVVPLRGAIGTAGILEAFSSRRNMFGEEQIDILRELAKIAESAYQRERRAQDEETLASLRGQRRLPNLFSRTSKGESKNSVELSTPSLDEVRPDGSETYSLRRYWIYGILAVALLLVLGIWLSWREPLPDLTKAEAKAPSTSASAAADHLSPASTVFAKPEAARSGRERKNSPTVLKTAAAIESVDATQTNSDSSRLAPANSRRADSVQPSPARPPNVSADQPIEPPPQVAMNTEGTATVAALVSDTKVLPIMGAALSQGITQGELIHKVDPVYPMQARAQRIAGSVVLEIMIALDGSVHNMKTVSGDPILATSARDAVRQWRYRPVLLDGKPIEAEKQITVLFKLP